MGKGGGVNGSYSSHSSSDVMLLGVHIPVSLSVRTIENVLCFEMNNS